MYIYIHIYTYIFIFIYPKLSTLNPKGSLLRTRDEVYSTAQEARAVAEKRLGCC